jgi:hypothetical protein
MRRVRSRVCAPTHLFELRVRISGCAIRIEREGGARPSQPPLRVMHDPQ